MLRKWGLLLRIATLNPQYDYENPAQNPSCKIIRLSEITNHIGLIKEGRINFLRD